MTVTDEDRVLAAEVVKLVSKHWTKIAGDTMGTIYLPPEGLSAVANRVATIRAEAAAAEREACAKEIERYPGLPSKWSWIVQSELAAAIRARSQNADKEQES